MNLVKSLGGSLEMLTLSILELVIGFVSVLFAALQYLNATRNSNNQQDSIDSNTDKSQNTDEIEDILESQSDDDEESQSDDDEELSEK